MTINARVGPRKQLRARSRQRGMTVVEFAVVIPLALLVLFGIVQLGLTYSAKEILNEATFVAARAGAFQNAQLDRMTTAMQTALIPFYQDTTNTNTISRLTGALSNAKQAEEAGCISGPPQCFLKLELLNPSPAAFEDFGITSNASGNHTFIPNDNLEIRPHDVRGPKSGLSIQDANALRIRVTYGYEMKVPLMKTVFAAIMCGVDNGVKAFGSGNTALVVGADDCTNYYSKGRIPIVAYATVQMQTPAWQADGN